MSTLTLSSQLRLKNLLVTLARHEIEVEQLRIQLARVDAFEPYAAYRLFDSIGKKFILPDDI